MKKKKEQKTSLIPKESGELLFAEAKIQAEISRHSSINKALDNAMGVINRVLEDSDKDDSEKFYCAKLAVDAYLLKEKLLREDAKYDLEKEKIKIEQDKLEIEKAKLSIPGGALYIIQNIQNNTTTQEKIRDSSSIESLKERKHLQAKLLEEVSGIPQFSSNEPSEKDHS